MGNIGIRTRSIFTVGLVFFSLISGVRGQTGPRGVISLTVQEECQGNAASFQILKPAILSWIKEAKWICADPGAGTNYQVQVNAITESAADQVAGFCTVVLKVKMTISAMPAGDIIFEYEYSPMKGMGKDCNAACRTAYSDSRQRLKEVLIEKLSSLK